LHNKPHGCSASVASAAGPFTAKKKTQHSTRDRHPWRRWDSNLQSQQANGRKPTP
jgi:hypothetical protein